MKHVAMILLLAVVFALFLTAEADVLTMPNDLVKIEEQAFYGDTSLDLVVLGDRVTSIGAKAFAGSSVDYVVMPASIRSIAANAFDGCGEVVFECSEGSVAWKYAQNHQNITTTVAPSGAETPASYFAYKPNNDYKTCTITGFTGTMENVVVPQTLGGFKVTAINDMKHCENLKTVYIPEGVTTLGHGAFLSCKNLVAVRLPESLTQIGGFAFGSCESLKTIHLPSNLTVMDDNVFNDCTSLRRIVIPKTLYTVQIGCFRGCTSLTEVILEEGVRDVYQECFENCKQLRSIVFPTSMVYIANYAFKDCDNLEDVTILGEMIGLGSHSFPNVKNIHCKVDCQTGRAVSNCGYYIISDECPDFLLNYSYKNFVEGVGSEVILTVCKYLGNETEVIIPEMIDGLPVGRTDSTFYKNENITSVILPKTLKYIGAGTFNGCYKLRTIDIPKGVVCIEACAFQDAGVEEMIIPDSVETIETGALSTWKKRKLVLPKGMTTINLDIIGGSAALVDLTLPAALTTIEEETFKYCHVLEELIMPDGVRFIADDAFCDHEIALYCHRGSVTDNTLKEMVKKGCLKASLLKYI